jgi:hypothetical protein
MIREMIEDNPMKDGLTMNLMQKGMPCPEDLKPVLFHRFTHFHKLINELEDEGNLPGGS